MGVTMLVVLGSLLYLCVLQGVVGARLGGGESCFEQGVDYLGNDLQEGHYDSTSSVAECQKAENIYKAIREINPDLLGAQECEGHERDVAAAIGNDYAIAGSATAGHSI